MSIDLVDKQYRDLIPKVGKNVIAAIYPKDFELYITALELVDSKGRIVEYFIFPLNPTNISHSDDQISNIKKTVGGVVVTNVQTFVPRDITIRGNFGRKFKFLLGKELISFSAFNLSEQINKNVSNFNNQVFSDTVKTGFGCIKILQRIIQKHNQLDSYGAPNTLHLYNLSFGESYVVKVVNKPTFVMDINDNMIWNYSVQFSALAPLDQISKEPASISNLKLLSASTIQKSINNQLGNIVASL